MYPVSILYKSIAGHNRPIRVADGPTSARYRFIKNASSVDSAIHLIWVFIMSSNEFPHLFLCTNKKGIYLETLLQEHLRLYFYITLPLILLT